MRGPVPKRNRLQRRTLQKNAFQKKRPPLESLNNRKCQQLKILSGQIAGMMTCIPVLVLPHARAQAFRTSKAAPRWHSYS